MTLYTESPGYDYDQLWLNHEHMLHGTLTLGSTDVTTVTNNRIKADSHILLTPTSAKAAAVVLGGTNTPNGIYVSTVADGSFSVIHDDHADAEGSVFTYFVFLPKQIVTSPATVRTT